MDDSYTLFLQSVIIRTETATATILIYDYFCTLDQEIKYVWSRPWGFSTILFLLNRYPPFVDTMLLLSSKFTQNSITKCHSVTACITWMAFLGIIVSEVILMLRTYAIWRRRSILILFSSMTVVTIVISGVCIQLYLNSLKFFVIPHRNGCFSTSTTKIIFIAFVLLAIMESVIAALMLSKAAQHLRQSRSPWVVALYRDGLLFYCFLLFLSVANVISPIVLPLFTSWLASPQRVFHSVLSSRILFLIFRNQAEPSTPPNRFTSVVDDSGETELGELTSAGLSSESR
ncbi:hypothetical protein C8J56DRAFT_949088 [Mycena floridula]|nr:hypothetical protein C8J56DRAFT_949088 [Mycena floridula]